MSQLKPCPFCGGDDLQVLTFGVQCRTCKTSGPIRREDSAKDWNTRDTADLRDAQIRALEWAATCYGDVDLKEQIEHLKAGGALI